MLIYYYYPFKLWKLRFISKSFLSMFIQQLSGYYNSKMLRQFIYIPYICGAKCPKISCIKKHVSAHKDYMNSALMIG